MHRSAVVGLVVFVLVVTVSASGLVAAGGFGAHSYSYSDADADSHSDGQSLVDPPEETLEPAVASPSTTDATTSKPSASVTRVQEFDSTRFEITVYADGTATYTFRHERLLETQEERENFRTFAEEFEAEETDLYERYTQMAQAMVSTGTEHTGREMAAEDFNRSTDIEYRPNAIGVVEITFTWTNFAPVDDEDGTVRVGDVFDGGLVIMPSQTLVIAAGDDLVFTEVIPEGEYPGTSLEAASSVRWSGEREFNDGHPRAILQPESEIQSSAADDSGTEPESEQILSEGSDWMLLGLLAVLGLGAVAAFTWYRTRSDEGLPASTTPSTPADSAVDATGTGSGSGSGAGAATGTAIGDGDVDDGVGGDAASPIPDEELMTDEDRVVSLIRQNGGRMKQVNIVEETGWSKSKVSMLLSEMEDEGTISKLRVGRENIISLEGFEPEATKSPFDE